VTEIRRFVKIKSLRNIGTETLNSKQGERNVKHINIQRNLKLFFGLLVCISFFGCSKNEEKLTVKVAEYNKNLLNEIKKKAADEVCGGKLNISGMGQFTELVSVSSSGGLVSYCTGMGDYALESIAKNNGKAYESTQKTGFIEYLSMCDNITFKESDEKFGMGRTRMETCSKIDAKVGRYSYCQKMLDSCGSLIGPVVDRFNETAEEFKSRKMNKDGKVTSTDSPTTVALEPVKPPELPTPAPPTPIVDNTPFTPSFDCAKASNGQEKLVCGDRELSKLDVALSQAYARARENSLDKDALKKQQLDWVKFSQRACSDKQCLIESYNKRLAELQ